MEPTIEGSSEAIHLGDDCTGTPILHDAMRCELQTISKCFTLHIGAMHEKDKD